VGTFRSLLVAFTSTVTGHMYHTPGSPPVGAAAACATLLGLWDSEGMFTRQKRNLRLV